MRQSLVLLLVLLCPWFDGALLSAESTHEPAATQHSPVIVHRVLELKGAKIPYTVAVESSDVANADGKPSARLVSFGYTADQPGDLSKRPVLFIFNGGPISASLYLHLGVMGPKRAEIPDDLTLGPDAYKLVDNAYSPLDTADMVFIDPASTGFSRVLPGTTQESYYSVAADGQQVAAFIRTWLKQHSRFSSPIFLVGESYGTIRAAEVAAQLAEQPQPILLSGVVLMGQALNVIEFSQRPQNIISYVVSLPTLAALGWYHQKVDRKGASLEEFTNQAWEYAQNDYLHALAQGSQLAPAERDRVALRLEQFTGIPASYYREHNLQITKEQYRKELFNDKKLLLGRTDGRYLKSITDKGLGADPSDVVTTGMARLFGKYLHEDLGINWPDDYKVMADVGGFEGWKWGATTPFSNWPYTDRMLKAMRANPHFRLLICNGYYDLQTTVGAARYAVLQAGWPSDRVGLRFYEGGHAAYTNEGVAKKFADDIRHFISQQP
jgi:carboxypeptidase C (cathepsin A)